MPGHARLHHAMSCAKMARFAFWVVDFDEPKEAKFSAICQVAAVCPHEIADWHHLANTTEPSVCGGDVALCQIAFIIC